MNPRYVFLVIVGAASLLPFHPAVGGPPTDPAVIGEWTQPAALPHSAVHSVMLPTGKVLFFDNMNWQMNDYTRSPASVWDPATGELTDVTLVDPRKVFCGGHVLLSDGRVLVAGGEIGIGRGPPHSFFFDAWTETWTSGPEMHVGRYYPSLLTLPDGRIVVMGGNDEDGRHTGPVEVLTPGPGESWEELEAGYRVMENYPKLHVLLNGSVVHTGPERQTLFFEPATAAWQVGPSSLEHREDGSSVLLPGLDRVLVLGGADFPFASATAEILELGPEPAWRSTSSMTFERRNQNAVLLPDGMVFVVGGASDSRTPVFVPEMFDPAEETWSLLAPHVTPRTYHSTATLLPDGRILVAGGDTELGFIPLGPPRAMEVYSPPYVFHGPRPAITSAPSHLDYGDSFAVGTPDASAITSVALVRAGSVTHSYDFDQRLVDLEFEASGGHLDVVAPQGPTHAPPGWYLLFLLNEDGVPSVATMVRLG